MKKLTYIIGIFGVLALFSCSKPSVVSIEESYLTENVIIIIMDGARYTETWGESNHSFIPNISTNIAPKSVVNTNFYNNQFTWTSPGHLAICSGKYYNLNNGGAELPPFPTIFQYFNEIYPTKSSWIISSKDKLEVLANTSDSVYNNLFMPNTDCGNNGLGTGYRKDSVTLSVALNIFSINHPNLALINFREPDYTAHANDSLGYLQQIHNIDSFINIIFNFVENDPIYKDKTTIFITNDHGRHDDLNGGFSGHGDSCEGCQHLLFCAFGPDFKQNKVINSAYEQIDVSPTIGKLLNFEIPNADGKVMEELFK